LVVTGSTSLTVTLTSLLAPPDGRSLGEPDAPGPAAWRGPQATVDGQPIVWRPSAGLDQDEGVPTNPATRDHVHAALRLDPGEHLLRVSPLPADGLPLAVAPAAVAAAAPTAGPVPHPGRRLLLAHPAPQETGADDADLEVMPDPAARPNVTAGPAVTVTRHAEGLDIHFADSPSYVVLDLGRTTVGRLRGTAEGPPGATLDVGWDERLVPATSWPLPHPGSLHPAWSQVDSLTLDTEPRAIESLDARAGRYVLIAAWQSPIVLRDLVVLDTRTPLRQRGWLHTGDAQLDALWQVGAETVRANSSDVYADPWRERGLWWGDAWAAQRAANVVFGDDSLRRRGLRLMAEPLAAGELVGFAPRGDQSRLRDYPLLWLLDLAEHQRFGEDEALLEETWPAVVTLMDRLEVETVGQRQGTPGSGPSLDTAADTVSDPAAGASGEGLLTLPEGPWHQSSFIDWAAGPARYGLSAPLNALYIDGLAAAAELATQRGETERAARWTQRAADLATALRETLWRPEARRFATSRLDGVLVPPGAHAQAWPLAHGIVPAGDMTAVAAALEELLVPETPISGGRDLPTVELYGFHWVLEAFGRSGRVDLGLAAMRRWHVPLLERGLSTWPESWTADERWDAALSHGWGAAPTVFLTRWLLGARRVAEHGWRLRPGWSGPIAVEGALPLAEGSLRVRWVRVGCTVGVIEIDAPRGAHGAIELPRAPDMKLWLDDRAIRVGAEDGDVVTIPLAPPSTAQGDGPTDPRFVRVPLAQGRHRIVAMPLGEPLCRR
jgi:alpha-L-rhamnosidase